MVIGLIWIEHIFNMPFRSIGKMTGGVTDMNMVEGLLSIVNGHFFSGLGKIISGYFKNSSGQGNPILFLKP